MVFMEDPHSLKLRIGVPRPRTKTACGARSQVGRSSSPKADPLAPATSKPKPDEPAQESILPRSNPVPAPSKPAVAKTEITADQPRPQLCQVRKFHPAVVSLGSSPATKYSEQTLWNVSNRKRLACRS